LSYITYEDDLVTEYSDGREEVRFTEAEWAAMRADPVRFGLARPCGHPLSYDADGQPISSDCLVCEYAHDGE
jgi:hypothetical protein